MIKGFLVKKKGVTQRYRENGELVAATVCDAKQCLILGVKTLEKDGYLAVQLGAGIRKRADKSLAGVLKKLGVVLPPKVIREVELVDEKQLPKPGEKISVDQVFSPGQLVNVAGCTKGRGFSGVIKRWSFHSQPKTHGQSDRERAPGSIGAQTPGRVNKGKKMPGRYGGKRKTVRNLEFLAVDKENEQVLIKGALPGCIGSWLLLTPQGKKRDFIPLAMNKINKVVEEGKDGEK